MVKEKALYIVKYDFMPEEGSYFGWSEKEVNVAADEGNLVEALEKARAMEDKEDQMIITDIYRAEIPFTYDRRTTMTDKIKFDLWGEIECLDKQLIEMRKANSKLATILSVSAVLNVALIAWAVV